MATINTPTGGDDELKSRLEGLTDEQKDKLFEILKEDKKSRENNSEGKSEKLINSESEYFDKVIDDIKRMKENVDKINDNKYKGKIFISDFQDIRDDIDEVINIFKNHINKWHSNENITYSNIIDKVQDILIKSFRPNGWINQLMILLSYSRSPIIKDQMKEHGIDVSLLENICSNITKMLNEINMEAVVPTVLKDNFDKNLHDYENCDIWIDKFFPNINSRDYKRGIIFDIASTGYKIKDEEGNIIKSKKPAVYFI